jgi:hypothetical protein
MIPSHPPEYRWELIVETLRVLFALESVRDKAILDPNATADHLLLHDILVDILLLPRNRKEHDCKIATLSLFMDASDHLADTLIKYDAIPELIYILKVQLNDLFVNAQGSSPGFIVPIRYRSGVTELLPILIALITLCKMNHRIQSQVRNEVFPEGEEDFYLEELKKHLDQDVIQDVVSGDILVAKNMQPIYAPPKSMLWQLIQLMSSVQSNVKRCTNELLWILCNADKVEFVLRTGFGNAVHFLGAKGLVNISGVYDTAAR